MTRALRLLIVLGLAGTALLADARGAVRAHSPRCTPTALGGSAVPLGSTLTVSPAPGTHAASARTQISMLGAPASAIDAVTAVGSRSGPHTGHLSAYSQGDGASWLPDRPFAPGEQVNMSVTVAGAAAPARWTFGVATPTVLVAGHRAPGPKPPRPEVQTFHSRPDLKPPSIAVTTSSVVQAPGLLFVAPYSGPEQSGPMIFDDRGQVVMFYPLPRGTQAADFRVQAYQGRPALTWWEDPPDARGHRTYQGVVVNSAYQVVATVRAGNGLEADHHEFEVGPSGTALMTVYDPIRCDLSSVGGPRDGAVWDGIVQEVDIATGLVRFEWHSLDHVALEESYASARRSSAGNPFDYFHLNSINRNRDHSLLLSARHTWAVYDMDARTGQVRWRLGGRNSSFAMGRHVRTAWQHDAREQPDGSISVFDNGAVPAVHPQSRGVVIRLDPVRQRATLVRRFEHPRHLVSASQGNLQALPNGDWLIGWGQLPWLSEFSSAGRLLFDAHLPPVEQSYRGFRFPWVGRPANPPAIGVVATGRRRMDVYASWNGATEVSQWQVLEGREPDALRLVATAARTGFETRVSARIAAPLVAVLAVDASGRILGVSPAVAD